MSKSKDFLEKLSKIRKYVLPYEGVRTLEDSTHRYCVVDSDGNTVVPYGRYKYISPFQYGLARVKTGTSDMGHRIYDGSLPTEAFIYKWGIIDNKGNEVVLPTYDYIRGFDRSRQESTPAKKGNQDCVIELRGLSKEYDEFLDDPGIFRPSYPSLYDDGEGRDFFAEVKESERYEDYAGTYAQDVEGYSDRFINEAFDGEPDAYWNID